MIKRISFLFGLIFLFSVNAKDISLKKGESKIFDTTSDIGTVFTSNPNVINYHIIGNKKLVVFAAENGKANIKVFSKDNSDTLISANFIVDDFSGELTKIAKLIELRNPGVKDIKIDRLSIPDPKAKKDEQGYIISGIVPNEEARDTVYKMAVLALGLPFDDDDIELQDSPSVSSLTDSNGGSGNGGGSAKELLQTPSSKQLIDKLELPKKNLVNIEVIIAEVNKSVLETLGIDIQGGIFKIPLFNPKTYADVFHQGAKAIGNINSILEAIKDDKAGKILARPHLSVLSGKQAYFNVSSTIGYAKPQISGTTGTISYDVGKEPISAISMEVTPKVLSDDDIMLDIKQIVNNTQNIDKENGVPIFSSRDREVKSTIELSNGDSFIISGLNDERESESVTSTPILGDIPILGALFRKTTISKNKSELVIIATVKLVDPLTPKESYSIPIYKPRGLIESVLNIDFKSKTKVKEEGNNFISNIDFIY